MATKSTLRFHLYQISNLLDHTNTEQTRTCGGSGGSDNLPWLVQDNIGIVNDRAGGALLHMDWSGSWGSGQR